MKLVVPPGIEIETVKIPRYRDPRGLFARIFNINQHLIEEISAEYFAGRSRWTTSVIDGDLKLYEKYQRLEFDNIIMHGVIPMNRVENGYECICDYAELKSETTDL